MQLIRLLNVVLQSATQNLSNKIVVCWFRIYCRSLDSTTESNLVLEEHDASRFVDIARTKDWQFITLNVNTKTSSEVFYLTIACALNSSSYVAVVELSFSKSWGMNSFMVFIKNVGTGLDVHTGH